MSKEKMPICENLNDFQYDIVATSVAKSFMSLSSTGHNASYFCIL